MNTVLCPVNPIGHEWDALACRWCPATRTAAEAIVSGLASRRGGDEDTARALLGTHRTEVYVEALHHAAKAAAVIHQNCHRDPSLCAGCQVRSDILDVLTSVADVLGEKGSREADATPTPDPLPSYLHALGEHGSDSERALYAAYRQAITEAQRLRGTNTTKGGA